MIAEAQTKFDFLNHIPFLFANVTDPAIATECIAQFDRLPERARHRSSLRLLAMGSEMRAAVEECADTGHVRPILQSEDQELQMGPPAGSPLVATPPSPRRIDRIP